MRQLNARGLLLPAAAAVVVLALLAFFLLRGDGSKQADTLKDLPAASDLLDALEDRVAAGDWTLEEGLQRSLAILAGEADAGEVLEGRKLIDVGGTGIVARAHDYLESGQDEKAKREINRLLGDLFLTHEELESRSEPLSYNGGSLQGPRLVSADPGLGRPTEPPRAERAAPFDCDSDVCFLYAERQYGPAVFRVYLPAELAIGQEQTLVDLILEAIDDTVPVYSTFLPFIFSTDIVISTEPRPDALAIVSQGDVNQTCPMTVFFPTIFAFETQATFKQTIAHELFHCYQAWNFPQASQVDDDCTRWWIEGTAEYFSNVVYPTTNDEWKFWALWYAERAVPVVDRAYENSMLFQFLANRIGDEDLIELLRTLPKSNDSCRPAQAAALAAFPNMQELFHDFGSDALGPGITDRSGERLKFDYDPIDKPVDGSSVAFKVPVGALVLDWYTAVFKQSGKRYVLTESAAGPGKASAGQPPPPGWDGPIPESVAVCPEARLTVLLTATKPGYQHNLDITEDKEADDACEPTPTPDKPLPDLPPLGGPGKSHGEPHLLTLDQLDYDFQAVGEFILIRSLSDDLEVQVRQKAVAGTLVSVNAAVVVATRGDVVAVYAGREEPLVINGKRQRLLEGDIKLPKGGKVTGADDTILVRTSDGAEIKLDVGSFFINVSVSLSEERKARVEGLLGNANGDPKDDITTRDGLVIPADPSAFSLPVRFIDLYKAFGDSWRVRQDESLFEYAPGESTATYTDATFPSTPVDISGFSTAQQQQAEADCRQAGVLDSDLLEDCVYDLLVSGEIEFAQLAAKLDQITRITDTGGIKSAPAAAYDDDGTLHIVYVDTTVAPGDVFHRSRDSLGVWSGPEKLSASTPRDFTIGSLALLRRPARGVCVFWSGGFASSPYGLYSRCLDGGGAWTPAVLAARGTFTASFLPAFTAAGDAKVATHAPPTDISVGEIVLNPDSSITDSLRFAIAGDGSYHAIWRELPNFAELGKRPVLLHSASSDGGVTWSKPNTLLSDTSGINIGSLLAAADGSLTLSWSRSERVTLQRWRPGTGWGQPQDIEGLCCSYYGAVDAAGNFHIASIDNAVGQDGTKGRIGYAKLRSLSAWDGWRVGYLFDEVDAGVGAFALGPAGAAAAFAIGGDLYFLPLD